MRHMSNLCKLGFMVAWEVKKICPLAHLEVRSTFSDNKYKRKNKLETLCCLGDNICINKSLKIDEDVGLLVLLDLQQDRQGDTHVSCRSTSPNRMPETTSQQQMFYILKLLPANIVVLSPIFPASKSSLLLAILDIFFYYVLPIICSQFAVIFVAACIVIANLPISVFFFVFFNLFLLFCYLFWHVQHKSSCRFFFMLQACTNLASYLVFWVLAAPFFSSVLCGGWHVPC